MWIEMTLLYLTVTIWLGNDATVTEILLKFRGRAKASWNAGKTTFIVQQEYFNNVIKIVQKQQGQKEDITFQKDVYNYPFSIQLPEGIPSSFEGLHGSVRYKLEVTVVRSWAFNLSRTAPFTVLSKLNLNELPNVSRQMIATDEKTVGSLCCASGPITATLTTDRQGYVPGETIKFWAEIRNDSSRNIKYSKAKFIMVSKHNVDKLNLNPTKEGLEFLKKEDFLQLARQYDLSEDKTSLSKREIKTFSGPGCRKLFIVVKTRQWKKFTSFTKARGKAYLLEERIHGLNRVLAFHRFLHPSCWAAVSSTYEILLKFRGRAKASWNAGNTTFIVQQEYFNNVIKIVQKQQGQKEDITFQKDVYNYPFSIQLPEGIPASFEGLHGSVRYKLEVTVVRSWAFNLSRTAPFTVLSKLNLNELPNVSRQMIATDERTVGSLCCASGPITATLTTDRQGYVPGETIKFWAEIRNDSSRNIKYSKAKFIMKVVYRCKNATMEEIHKLYKSKGQSIPPGRTDTWPEQSISIPPLPPSFLLGCSIINIRYFVSITAVPSGTASSLVVPVEVIVGTIPKLMAGQNQSQPDFRQNGIIKRAFTPLYHYYNLDESHTVNNSDIVR